jgi:molybdopterin/thiamine biosynthesis adenylyltransferase
MWRDGDDSLRWTTLEGLHGRIEEWCREAKQGWKADDLGLDALLNYRDRLDSLATFDLIDIGVSRGSMGDFRGTVASVGAPVVLGPGLAQPGQLRGVWFQVGELQGPPPRQFSEVFTHLNRIQRRHLQAQIAKRRQPDPLGASGGVDLVMICWARDGRPDLLVLVLEGLGEDAQAKALQLGPNDEATLMLRAGPDAPRLKGFRAVVFGAGALGGNVAVALAESGVGTLDLVDGDILTPGNVVRHVAGHWAVGWPKVAAVAATISHHATWTKANTFIERPRTPVEIRTRIGHAGIVVDATSDGAFAASVASVALRQGIPLVAGALYRGGFLGRLRRQAHANDIPIERRSDLDRYPLIPPGDIDVDFATPDVGCSTPVNNAPPAVVLSLSSLIAQSAIDVLTNRFELADEIIEVYRALPGEPPFDRLGRIHGS